MMKDNFKDQSYLQEEDAIDIKKEAGYYLFFWPYFIAAVIIAILIMMLFASPVSDFVNDHPSLQILGLSFLLLIGFMLIAEAANLSNTEIFGASIGRIPKGYLYFSITFSLGVEMLNMHIRKRKKN